MKWSWWIFLANWFVFFGCKYPKMDMGWIWLYRYYFFKKMHIASTTNISRFNTSTVLDFQTWCLGTSAGNPLCLMGTVYIYIYYIYMYINTYIYIQIYKYTYIYILLDYLNKANPLNVTLDIYLSVQSLKFVCFFFTFKSTIYICLISKPQINGQGKLRYPRSGKIWAAPWRIWELWEEPEKCDGYPLVNIQKAMERSTIFNGKINYFDWAIFNSKLLVITRG